MKFCFINSKQQDHTPGQYNTLIFNHTCDKSLCNLLQQNLTQPFEILGSSEIHH